MRRFFSTTLGQILAIIAGSSALTFVLFIALLSALNPNEPPTPPWPWPPAYRIATLVDALRAVPESDRGAVIGAAQRPGLSIRLTQAPAACQTLNWNTRDLEGVLKSEFGDSLPDVTVRSCDSEASTAPTQVLIGMGDETLEARIGDIARGPPRITFPFTAALLFLCVAVAAMSAWAAWRVIRPLRRLSEQADAFGPDFTLAPIAEEGPLEIRRAARAFNLMQERITRSMQDRTRTLAAISHDLRTPLTRMRLQLQRGLSGPASGGTNGAQDKLLRDVDLMQSMVTSALAFLSGRFDREDMEWLDLGALLSTLCDEYEERGASVSYEGPQQIRLFCRPNAITRALTNLIENGIHFGDNVFIAASDGSAAITIDVADDGPGIPKDRVRDVVEPFVRLDPSRSNRPGSVGLGLAIVKEIVAGHGGSFELTDRKPTGLIARIVLPKLREASVSS